MILQRLMTKNPQFSIDVRIQVGSPDIILITSYRAFRGNELLIGRERSAKLRGERTRPNLAEIEGPSSEKDISRSGHEVVK
jgi:hypothetical protein